MTEAYELWALHEHLELFRRVHLSFQAHRPPLHRGTWHAVDSALDAAIAAAPLNVAVLLTPKDAGSLGSSVYVFFEPLVDLVISLGYVDARVSIDADRDLWSARSAGGSVADRRRRLALRPSPRRR